MSMARSPLGRCSLPSPTGCVAVGLLLGVLCGAAQADVENLEQFLRACEAATHVNVPLRGDGQLEVTTLGGAPPSSTTRSAAVVIVRPPADVYMELREPGFKAVLLSRGKAYTHR